MPTAIRLPLLFALGIFATSIRAADPAAIRALTRAYDLSAHELFVAMASAPGNIVCSPSSIGSAMAMALSGARGDTETEMRTVLHHTLPRIEVARANAEWLTTQASTTSGSRGSVQLVTANALILVGDGRVSPDFITTLRDDYRADVLEHATVESVNGWVSRKTEGKIGRILDSLDRRAPAVIVNATYFKASWTTPFDPRATLAQPFHLSSSAAVDVLTMRASGRYAIAAADGYRAIRLPYAGDALAMIIVLPDASVTIDDIVARVGPNAVLGMNTALETASQVPVRLALPRFKTGFAAHLAPLFERHGMALAFDPARADFSGITGQAPRKAPMAIGDIVHRAVIDVTEEGTQAAAATAILPRTTAVQRLPQPFVVDRPFLFYVVDGPSGAILFQGRISDPRAPMSD